MPLIMSAISPETVFAAFLTGSALKCGDLYLGVAEWLAEHRQSLAVGYRHRREGVALHIGVVM